MRAPRRGRSRGRRGRVLRHARPSGSGKTTCLRLIAGFEQPTAGRHPSIFGDAVEGVPPYRRNVNTVFQDYALFPHMNVRDNVAFSLMLRKVDKAERAREADAALELVKLGGYGDRRPGQLSGGQRQRVALARAIVNKPKVLLLDEPLGALDLKLREQMQEELKALQRTLGITFIFVTHDQGEALSMADRVAVFNFGQPACRSARPEEIYRRPNSRFVADFVGSSNVLAPGLRRTTLLGERRWASLRPEAIHLDPRRQRRRSTLSGTVDVALLSRRGQRGSASTSRRHAAACRGALRPAKSRPRAKGSRSASPSEALHLMEDDG